MESRDASTGADPLPVPDRPLHALFVTLGYKPAYRIGGPIISVAALAEGMVARGHRVTVFTTDSNLDQDLDVPVDRPVDVDGVTVWYFRRVDPVRKYLRGIAYLGRSIGYLHTPAMPGALKRILGTVDLVHTQMPFVSPTRLAGLAAIRAGVPLFYHQRGVFDPERLAYRGMKKRLYIRLVERRLLAGATTLIALTEAEVESYRALGVDTPCRIVPNGIDAAAYRTGPSPAFGGVPGDRQVILFLGRLHEIKGGDLLLDAFIRVAAAHPKAVLVMAGPDEGLLQDSYRARLEQAGLSGRTLFPGMLTGGAKLDWLARADLFCLPSRAEGFSMAVLEAMASGTPVMLSPGCHFPRAAQVGAGWVVPRTVADWARALDRVLSDPARLADAGARARDLVEREFAWPGIVARMEAVYREGIARVAAARPSTGVRLR